MKRKILYVSNIARIGGAEVSFLSLLERIDRETFFPIVLVPSEGLLADRLRKIEADVVILPLYDGSRKQPFPFLKSVWRLAQLIRRKHISIVHANIERCNRPVAVAAKLARVRQICHIRNLQTRDSFRHFFLSMSTYFIANSEATAQSYARYLRPSQESWVVYNGVNLDKFDGSRYPKSHFGIPDDAYVIAQVCRIAPEKGIHLFVESLGQIADIYPNVYGLIAGDTSVYGSEDYLIKLKKQVSQLGIENKVRFVGYIVDIEKVYGASDLLVQPSVAEPFGRTLIEAMAMQVPVITTRAGGAVEVVEDEETGLLVPPADVNAIVQAILRLIENKKLACKLARAGRKRVEKEFTIEEHARRIQEVYAHILSVS